MLSLTKPDCPAVVSDELPQSAPPHLAIRTDFSHHGAQAGYKQLLRYTKPNRVYGIDETHPGSHGRLRSRYKWLAEFPAALFARRHRIPLIHILYGEEYFRFSTFLPSRARVVVTFHQPPDLLWDEMNKGGRSRSYRLTHRLTRSRLRHVDAVIATTSQQKDVLAEFIPQDRIVCIPLGCYSNEKIDAAEQSTRSIQGTQLLTVGNWRRDWELYLRFAQHCATTHPAWRFVLVNRKMCGDMLARLNRLPNFEFAVDIDEQQLRQLYRQSRVQFLPLLSAAGSNAVNESLAYGLPVVTNIQLDNAAYGSEAVRSCEAANVCDLDEQCTAVIESSDTEYVRLRTDAERVARAFDWSVVAAKTIQLYWSLL